MRVALTIRSLPSLIPPEQRLKAILKRLLRTYGFRCEECYRLGRNESGLERLRKLKLELQPPT